jgi:hypothetical protein
VQRSVAFAAPHAAFWQYFAAACAARAVSFISEKSNPHLYHASS